MADSFHCSSTYKIEYCCMITSTLKKSQSMAHHRRPEPASKESTCGLEQTSAFLKKQIGEIIKNELKAYHLRNKLEAELEQYNKQQENQKLARTMVQDRINDFRDKEKTFRRKQFELFQRKQREREERLRGFLQQKAGTHQAKCLQVNRSICDVRDRYFNLANEDASARLSKLAPFTAGGKRHQRSHHSEARSVSISHSSSRVNIIRVQEAELEKHKITNYLNKIQKSQSRVMLKEVENIKRRETSMRRKVKCLVGQRKKMEEERMDRAEKEYNQRMAAFEGNHSRIAETKELNLISKVAVNNRYREQIIQRRQQFHKDQIDKIVNSYNGGSKENLLQHYRSTLDLNYTLKNRSSNLSKKKEQDQEARLQHNMRVLTDKLQKIKAVQYGEKLDDFSVKTILALMDKDDPQYPAILQFLRSERGTFIEGIVRRQEQKNKQKKMGKAVSKHGSPL